MLIPSRIFFFANNRKRCNLPEQFILFFFLLCKINFVFDAYYWECTLLKFELSLVNLTNLNLNSISQIPHNNFLSFKRCWFHTGLNFNKRRAALHILHINMLWMYSPYIFQSLWTNKCYSLTLIFTYIYKSIKAHCQLCIKSNCEAPPSLKHA